MTETKAAMNSLQDVGNNGVDVKHGVNGNAEEWMILSAEIQK